MSLEKKIVVLGAGAWGMTIASLLADNGHQVALWSFEPDVAQDIALSRINKRYFPDALVHRAISPTSDLREALDGATLIFEAVPVVYLRSVLQVIACNDPAAGRVPWVFLSKGIEQETFFVPTQIALDVFKHEMHNTVLGGPNFAVDLMRKSLTATVIASDHQVCINDVSSILSNHYFKTYASSDPLGVQLCGALKNVIALAIGIAEGAGFGHENTVAYLMTQGLTEIAYFVDSVGGKKETVYGLAGVGDMMLTCSSTLSKNKRFGKKIGQGLSLADCMQQVPVIPEGINTVQTLHAMIVQQGLVMPLCQAVYATVFEGAPFACNF